MDSHTITIPGLYERDLLPLSDRAALEDSYHVNLGTAPPWTVRGTLFAWWVQRQHVRRDRRNK